MTASSTSSPELAWFKGLRGNASWRKRSNVLRSERCSRRLSSRRRTSISSRRCSLPGLSLAAPMLGSRTPTARGNSRSHRHPELRGLSLFMASIGTFTRRAVASTRGGRASGVAELLERSTRAPRLLTPPGAENALPAETLIQEMQMFRLLSCRFDRILQHAPERFAKHPS